MRESVFRVRWYQRAFHKALVNRTHNRLIAVWHRRAGKDEVLLNAMRDLALNDPGTYWHCFPEQKQARKAIWLGVDGHSGRRRIDQVFPPEIRRRMLDDEMFIELVNGATFQLIGSDRFDSTVGSGPKGIGYSEWAMSNPAAWAYHQPMIRETGGFAAFITTPRGRNHVKTMYDRAQGSDAWFSEILTARDTRALSDADLDEARQEYIDQFGADVGTAYFEQEYLCNFNAAILGAFYAREMAAVRAEGRVDEIEPMPRPVHRAWDIGVRDDTSIWWFQVVGAQVFVLDCYTASGVGVEHYAEVIQARREDHGWQDGNDYVPHDAKVKEWGSGRTRVETMRGYGLHPVLCTDAGKMDGINAARQTLARAVFHPRCEEVGIAALEQYRREWDDEKKTFRASEVHDWTCHLADAWRYLSLSWKAARAEAPPPKPAAPPPGYMAPPPVPSARKGRIRL